ncbi:MAG TPA: aromatic ring-hydroxylating dioxygenase subunit alpha [Stellaceae bacterium]|nr:aromatic ring-hydroxylating dioxygenase subunit alpha [Stellaceae bacterium]
MLDQPMSAGDPGIFSPATYAAVRRPLEECETLPPFCYTSEAFFRREVERVFMKAWNFIGRADRIPNPGDYFAFSFVGVPAVVVRGNDGEVRAFANSCRHRGSSIAVGEGSVRAFRCPYHSWAYGLDGKLLSAPEIDRSRNFDFAQYGLVPLRLETWAGFMFLNFDAGAAPLVAWLGDLPQRLSSYRFEDMVCVRRKEYLLDCNWKVYVENAMEAYHVPTVHRSTLQRQKGPPSQKQPTQGEWIALWKEHEGSRALLAGESGFPYIDGLEGEAARGTWYPLIYPSTMFGATRDCMWWLELHPLSAAQTRLIVGSAFPRKTVARNDFAEVVERYYRRWDISIPEDNDISNLQQQGLTSPFARPGRLTHLEPLVHDLANWVLDRVLDEPHR